MYPRSMFLSKNMKIIKNFQLKIVIFTAVKNISILHGRVFVMNVELLMIDGYGYLNHCSCNYICLTHMLTGTKKQQTMFILIFSQNDCVAFLKLLTDTDVGGIFLVPCLTQALIGPRVILTHSVSLGGTGVDSSTTLIYVHGTLGTAIANLTHTASDWVTALGSNTTVTLVSTVFSEKPIASWKQRMISLIELAQKCYILVMVTNK